MNVAEWMEDTFKSSSSFRLWFDPAANKSKHLAAEETFTAEERFNFPPTSGEESS